VDYQLQLKIVYLVLFQDDLLAKKQKTKQKKKQINIKK
jgi:hypothetical protein